MKFNFASTFAIDTLFIGTLALLSCSYCEEQSSQVELHGSPLSNKAEEAR